MNLSPLKPEKVQYVDGTRVINEKSHFFVDFTEEELEQDLSEKIDQIFIHCINQKNGFRIKAYDHPALTQLGFGIVSPVERKKPDRKITDLTVQEIIGRLTRLASQITRPLDPGDLCRCPNCYEIQMQSKRHSFCHWPTIVEPPKPIQECTIRQTSYPNGTKISLVVEGKTQAEAILENQTNHYVIKSVNDLSKERFEYPIERIFDEIFSLCSKMPFGYRISVEAPPMIVDRLIHYGFEMLPELSPKRREKSTKMRLSLKGLQALSSRLNKPIEGVGDLTALYECRSCNIFQNIAIPHQNCRPNVRSQEPSSEERKQPVTNKPDERTIGTPRPID